MNHLEVPAVEEAATLLRIEWIRRPLTGEAHE